MAKKSDTSDLKRMQKDLARLGVEGQRIVERAAQKGADIVLAAATSTAPVKTGELKNSLILVEEHSKHEPKKVYQIAPDRAKNDVLQKPVRKTGLYGGKSKIAYYPASMEFGFWAKRKGGDVQKVPGKRYLYKGALRAESKAKALMMKELEENVKKVLGGG